MSTIYIPLDNPILLNETYPGLYFSLTWDGFYGPVQGCAPSCMTFDPNRWWDDISGLEQTFPAGTNFAFSSPGVPEPATAALFAMGLLAAMWFNRRVA